MKRVLILQNVGPFSVNSLYYSSRTVKTQAYHSWSFQIFDRLSRPEVQELLSEIKQDFDLETQAFKVRLTAFYPEKYFYRKAKGISAKTMDLSNWEKPLIDLLFLPKYAKMTPPYGAPNLEVDDRYIISLNSRKLPTTDKVPSLRIEIEIVSLPKPKPTCLEG